MENVKSALSFVLLKKKDTADEILNKNVNINCREGNAYLRLTGGLRRLMSSLGRLLQDGGGPRLLERFSPVDNSTRTRQPHMVLTKRGHNMCGENAEN